MEQDEIRRRRDKLAKDFTELRDRLYNICSVWNDLSKMCNNPFHQLPADKKSGRECPDCGAIQIKKRRMKL